MPRTTGTIQRVLPTSAPARVVRPQPRPGFKPATSPARVVNPSARVANFTPPRVARMTMSQAASQISTANPIINTANTPASNCCCAACSGLQCLDRTRFFSGQLLTDADLNNEQSYLLAKNRLHNRYLHGYGVVCGLQVTCGECPGWVNISPGYAIDPCGNDIIVCTAQSFNVLQAIQNCCTPPAQTTNCSPVRNLPPPTCQQQVQTWCITIQYQEQQSNMVTPLQTVSSSNGCGCGTTSCTCGGCAGSNKMSMTGSGECGCGCHGNSNSGCSCSSCAASTSSSAAAACQATRILEGFQLGVCQSPTQNFRVVPVTGNFNNVSAEASQDSPFPGYQQLNNLVISKPALVNSNGVATMSNSQAYQAACQYLTSAQNIYSKAGIQNCQGYADLNRINIAPPPSANDPTYATYPQGLQTNVNSIATNVTNRSFELLCAAMMPPCPPPACDTRLVLACVTVCGGNIMNICQFGGGRKLLVGFPTIAYWLSLLNPNFSEDLGAALERLCCDTSQYARATFNGDNYARAVLSGTTGTPDMFNRAVTSYVAQVMGSAIVNSASPQAATVDLRPLVGLPLAQVQSTLRGYKILTDDQDKDSSTTVNNVSYYDVSADPAWTDDAIASAASYAPAAFKISNPLTVYIRGASGTIAGTTNTVAENSLVVGFAVTSPTDYLSNQISALQGQISTLQNQMTGMQTPPANPPATAPTATPSTPAPAPQTQALDTSTKPGKKK
jgi:hypothetical protein